MNNSDPVLVHKHPSNWFVEAMKESQNVGAREFLEKPENQKSNERLIASIFAFGIRSITKREWWMQQLADPPDFEMVSATDRLTKDKPMDHRQVEMVEVPQVVDQEDDPVVAAWDIVRTRKLEKSDKYDGYALLIFVNSTHAPAIISDLRTRIPASIGKKGINEVWTMNLKISGKFIFEINGIYPNTQSVDINPIDEAQKGELYPHPRNNSLKAGKPRPI